MGRRAGDILILYNAYYFHLAGTFWASQRVNFIYWYKSQSRDPCLFYTNKEAF
jgi:hypothetical protein